jgi:hypothetical protein
VALSAVVLYILAREAYERCGGLEADRLSRTWDPLVAILFSAAALEAFIAESVAVAEGHSSEDVQHGPVLREFSRRVRALERQRDQVRKQYLAAYHVLSGNPLPKNAQVYQNLSLLVKLRNAIVHLQPTPLVRRVGNTFGTSPPPVLKKLSSKNVLAQNDLAGAVTTDWLSIVSTRATARWACNTAADLVHGVALFAPPQTWLQQLWELSYLNNPAFQRVN